MSHSELRWSDSSGLFQTKPEILIKDGMKVVQVIDTKWKRIATHLNDRKRGVAQADVYQMMAYGRLYNCPRLTLLYPHQAELGDEDGLQASHRVTGSEHSLETSTIDTATVAGINERLRFIAGGVIAGDIISMLAVGT